MNDGNYGGLMPRMLKELERAPPEAGVLGHNGLGLMALVQYWRSFEHLEKYARSRDQSIGLPGWNLTGK